MSTGYQTILSLGAEMGAITRLGTQADGRWTFIIDVSDSSAALLDEGENDVVRHTVPAATLEDAFASLDRYRWYKLHPESVHPDFPDAVWRAGNERCAGLGARQGMLQRWGAACGLDHERSN